MEKESKQPDQEKVEQQAEKVKPSNVQLDEQEEQYEETNSLSSIPGNDFKRLLGCG